MELQWERLTLCNPLLLKGKLIETENSHPFGLSLWKKKTFRGQTHYQIEVATSQPLSSSIGVFLPKSETFYSADGTIAACFYNTKATDKNEQLIIPTVIDFFQTTDDFVSKSNTEWLDGVIGYCGSIPLPLNFHGPLMTGFFGCPQFDPLFNRYIIYCAEDDPKITKSDSDADVVYSIDKFNYTSDWGESHKGERLGRVFILDRKSRNFRKIEWPHPWESLGQVIWAPDLSGFCVTAWDLRNADRLGISACQNRVSWIYFCRFGEDFDVLSCQRINIVGASALGGTLVSAHSPCFSRVDGSAPLLACCYLEPPSRYQHWGPVRLAVGRFDPLSVELCLTHELFNPELRDQPFPWKSLNSETMIFQALECSNCTPTVRTALLSLKKSSDEPTVTFLETTTDKIVRLLDIAPIKNEKAFITFIAVSTPASSPSLELWQLIPSAENGMQRKLCPQTYHSCYLVISSDSRPPKPLLNPMAWEWIANRHLLLWPGNSDADALLQKRPLILSIHGGPHSLTLAEYSTGLAFLVSQGFTILCVNYRGSLGFSQEEVCSLASHVGDHDVQDCVLAVNALYATDSIYKTTASPNTTRFYVLGGSHGGFLALHIAATYPARVLGASVRNPVTNLVSNLCMSDIPDWNLYEGKGITRGLAGSIHPLSKEELSSLYESSPISSASKVKCPVLMALGKEDRRVPMAQGLEYFRELLLTHGGKSRAHRLLVYPSNDHALDQPEAEANYWIATASFFLTISGIDSSGSHSPGAASPSQN